MIQTLLDAIHRQQIEQYEDEKVYELDCRNPKAEDSDGAAGDTCSRIFRFTEND